MVHLHTELKSHSGKFRREKYAPPAAASDEKKGGVCLHPEKRGTYISLWFFTYGANYFISFYC